MKLTWVEGPEQRVWVWIATVFAVFYVGEAILFWGPNPRVEAPSFTPLVYWGAFGACVIALVARQPKPTLDERALRVPSGLQTTVLGIGITASVVGMAFVVMALAGKVHNVTLGHAILLAAMFEAGAVIGGMSGNLGWLAAGIVWAVAAGLVLGFPRVQDYTLGAALAIGFALVGLVRWCVREKEDRDENVEIPVR